MITRTLRLASPYMRGNDVKAAQGTLISKGLLALKSADGVFGPVTASAAKQARWNLGYQTANCTQTYDKALDEYLRGKRQPTVLMRQRAKARGSRPASGMGEKAAATMVEWAIEGLSENPAGTNFVPQLSILAKRLGCPAWIVAMRYPWCGLGVFTAALQHGAISGKTGLKDAAWNALYTPTIQQMARENRYGLRAVSVKQSIVRGTGLLFDFDGGGVDHVGIALGKPGQVVTINGTKWRPKRSEVVTVESNTARQGETGSQADGGCVAIRIRSVSLIATAFTIS